MGNGGTLEGDGDHILLCILNSLADCLGNLGCLTKADTDVTVLVAHNHESCEASHTTTLNGLGNTVQSDERFLQLDLCRIKLVSHSFVSS